MEPLTIIQMFNLVAPQALAVIRNIRDSNPQMSYEEALREAGVKLDAEEARLLADMAKAVADGAIPR